MVPQAWWTPTLSHLEPPLLCPSLPAQPAPEIAVSDPVSCHQIPAPDLPEPLVSCPDDLLPRSSPGRWGRAGPTLHTGVCSDATSLGAPAPSQALPVSVPGPACIWGTSPAARPQDGGLGRWSWGRSAESQLSCDAPSGDPPATRPRAAGTLAHRELAHVASVHQLVLLLRRDGVGHFLGGRESAWAPGAGDPAGRSWAPGCLELPPTPDGGTGLPSPPARAAGPAGPPGLPLAAALSDAEASAPRPRHSPRGPAPSPARLGY